MKRKSRGRPPIYVWDEDQKLSESEKRTKLSVQRRRERQRKSYYKKKNRETKLAVSKKNKIESDFPVNLDFETPLEDYIYDDFFCLDHLKQSNSHQNPLVVVREYVVI